MAYSVESTEDGVYNVTTQTRYNAEGEPIVSQQKQLVSQFSATLAQKSITINERGLTSTQWTVYNGCTKTTSYINIPSSTITAETVTVDEFVVTQKDDYRNDQSVPGFYNRKTGRPLPHSIQKKLWIRQSGL